MAVPSPRRHVRRARALRAAVLPLLLAGTAVAVLAALTGGSWAPRVAALVVLVLGIAAAVASDADARRERRSLLAERAQLSTAFAEAYARIRREHADSADELAAVLNGRIGRIRDRLVSSHTQLLATREQLDVAHAELAVARSELVRVTRQRDGLQADLDAAVERDDARLRAQAEANVEAVRADRDAASPPVPDWQQRATG